MSNPTIYTFNGKMARVGNGVLGSIPAEPVDYVTIGTQTWKRTYLDLEPEASATSTWYKDPETGVHYYRVQSIQSRILSLIPTGWRLPTTSDFTTLFNFVGSTNEEKFNALASTDGWTAGGGNDTYGLSLLPTGEAYGANNSSLQWSGKGIGSTIVGAISSSKIANFLIYHNGSNYGGGVSSSNSSANDWYPIRLIKDE